MAKARRSLIRQAGPWIVIVAVVVFNIWYVSYEGGYRQKIQEEIERSFRDRQENTARLLALDVASYLRRAYERLMVLAIIAAEGPGSGAVERLEAVARTSFRDTEEIVLCAVKVGYDGARPPWWTLDPAGADPARVLAAEPLQELAAQMAQFRSSNPPVLMSTNVPHPGGWGVILAAPIKRDKVLLGLVAALLPARHFSGLVRPVEEHQQVLVLDEEGHSATPKLAARLLSPAARDIILKTRPERGRTFVDDRMGQVISHAISPREVPGPWRAVVVTPAKVVAEEAARRAGPPLSARGVVVLVLGNALGFLILRSLRDLQTQATQYKREAEVDAVTGVRTRRFLDRALEQIAGGKDDAVGLLMIDLNDFKHYNDAFGHEVGDQILREAGRLLLRCTRTSDVVARYGGDEFVIVTAEAGAQALPAIRTRIHEALTAWNRSAPIEGVTLSMAIGSAQGPAADHKRLLVAADAAMYEAKGQR